METEKELLARMIKIYGPEHEEVKEFISLIENGVYDEVLRTIVECHETVALLNEDENKEDF